VLIGAMLVSIVCIPSTFPWIVNYNVLLSLPRHFMFT
jgi:hypothetical protein